MAPLIGPETKVTDLGGKFVMPGIVDMHAPPFSGVDLGTGSANLTEPDNPEAILAAVEEFIAENPDRDVIPGGNWSVGGIFELAPPTKSGMVQFQVTRGLAVMRDDLPGRLSSWKLDLRVAVKCYAELDVVGPYPKSHVLVRRRMDGCEQENRWRGTKEMLAKKKWSWSEACIAQQVMGRGSVTD